MIPVNCCAQKVSWHFPNTTFAALLLAALLALPGCAPKAAKTPTDTAVGPDSAATLPPEAEIKPAPIDTLPAAVAPMVAAPSTTVQPANPAVPEQATKKALEPAPVRTAALTPPRSEPAAPTSQPSEAPRLPGLPAAPAAKPAKAKAEGPAVAVVGDSLAVGVGMTMEARLSKAGTIGCRPMGKISTGLISKKYDWDKALTELLARESIAAVVVVLGGNDANNSIAGKAAGTPEWNEAYVQKVERFLRIAADAKVMVLWVGLPAMKDAAYSKRVVAVNAAAKRACSTVAGCTYMEATDIFTDEAGNYVQAKDIGGKTVSLRAGDGVHMTMTGYDLLCRRVLDTLDLTGDRTRP